MTKNIYTTSLLLVVIFLNLVDKINSVEPPELTFVVTNNGNNNTELICIAEGNVLNSAIGWIYPIVDSKSKLPEIVSSYIPNIKNDYDCNFTKPQYCNSLWQMQDWQYSKWDSHNFKCTLDARWEGFPTFVTSNSTQEFNTRIAIPPQFQIGFSVRAAKNAEIFLCEAWNPHNYPCYYINIGGSDNKQAFLRKYKNIPDKLSKNDTKLVKYKSDVGILSEDEWKNFIVSLDSTGNLKLIEKYKNATLLNYTDKKPFQPIYLFIRSKFDTALWKIHNNSTGNLKLIEKYNNTTLLNYTDKETLQPIYLFIRSKFDTALWKIHNNQYMFTNKTKVSQLGPSFEIYGNTLCLSLYVTMCKDCTMTFFVQDGGDKKILQEVSIDSDQEDMVWKLIKLVQHNIIDDQLQLFVETKYTNNTVRNEIWAVDDVRICAENEIKVSRLLTKMDITEVEKTEFSCHALDFPIWRPTQHISSSHGAAEEIKYMKATPTSIRLAWKNPTTSAESYQHYYLIQYEAIDICSIDNNSRLFPRTKLRQKSQGYVIDKTNEITIKNLTPYTNYNLTLLNIIHNYKWSHEISTLPTDVPTKEELPRNLSLTATDVSLKIKWDGPKCNEIYGLRVYQININSRDGNDNKSTIDVNTEYLFENLLPDTYYSAEIITARTIEYLNNTRLSIKTIYSFTTRPGIAPSVKNLELYATDQHSAHLRYDLPSNLGGTPKEVQVQWCHPLFVSGCTTEIRNLTKCKLWTEKYCLDINGLIKGYDYKFTVAIKNDKTSAFGKQETIVGTALDRVPGIPLNITFKMIDCDKTQDYCNMNISWAHPYNQNATITMFDVMLNKSSYGLAADTWRNIHEIQKIEKKAYKPTYSYIIRYIPYSTPFKISVRAANEAYKGNFASVNIKTDDIGHYVDQTPIFFNCTNETVSFMLPQLDWRLRTSTLIVVAQDYDTNKKHIDNEIVNLEMYENKNRLCNEYGETWIAKVVEISNKSSPIVVIGDGTSSYLSQLGKSVTNKPLQPDTDYCFTFTLINEYKNSKNIAVYHEKHVSTEGNGNYTAFPRQTDKPEESTNVAAYVVPILFVALWITCAIWFTYRYLKRKKRNSNNGDHIYESMPFEEYTPDAVSNQTYDRLIHD